MQNEIGNVPEHTNSENRTVSDTSDTSTPDTPNTSTQWIAGLVVSLLVFGITLRWIYKKRKTFKGDELDATFRQFLGKSYKIS